LIDAVPIPITVKDAQGRYTEVNAAYQLLAGMTRQQMVGHLPTELNVGETARPRRWKPARGGPWRPDNYSSLRWTIRTPMG
jgi:PAS domain-containing protein